MERKQSAPWLMGLSSAAFPEISGAAAHGPELYVASAAAPETLAEKLEQLAHDASLAKPDPQALANETPGSWRAALVRKMFSKSANWL